MSGGADRVGGTPDLHVPSTPVMMVADLCGGRKLCWRHETVGAHGGRRGRASV